MLFGFLVMNAGARHVGQAVLEKAETYLKTYNISRIYAFSQDCRYRFYHFSHAYLSDALDQVQALLGFNGYRRSAGEVFLDWENYASYTNAFKSVQWNAFYGLGRRTRRTSELHCESATKMR